MHTNNCDRWNRNHQRYKRVFGVLLIVLFTLIFTVSYADEIRSRAAVVLDASTGKILYAKNPNLRRPPASTTKMMTAIVVLENKDLDEIVTVSKFATKASPHRAGFKKGDKVKIEELLYAALLGSANDAAIALAESVSGSEAKFVKLMNKKARSIGAKNTKFLNSNGLPRAGQYTTASDLAKIMRYALGYQKIKDIIGTRSAEVSIENGNSILVKNTNKLLWSDEYLVGGKTGYTRKARHCFVCAAERDDETVIVALLGSPSRSNLWKESEVLIGKGFDILSNKGKSIIYSTESTYGDSFAKNEVHKNGYKSKKISKSKGDKAIIAKNNKTLRSAKFLTKKSHEKKVLTKYRKKKSESIAKKFGVEKHRG